MTDKTNLKNKNVLVTGGTTGIGRATAKLLAEEGAKVMIFGRNKDHLNDALSEIKKYGQIFGVVADVSIETDIDRVFSEFKERYGDIDILINNASLPARSITANSYSKMEYVLKTNVLGYMYCAKKSYEIMKKNGQGHIVNIGSMSAKAKEEKADLYVSTKSAVEGFSESLRKKINRSGIKLSLIEPGSVGTSMIDEDLEEQKILQEELLLLKAEDIAEAILFCLTRPKRCEIICIEIKPHRQII